VPTPPAPVAQAPAPAPIAPAPVTQAPAPAPTPPAPVAPTPAPAPQAPTPAPKPPAAKAAECIKIQATTEPTGLKEEGRWLHDHYPRWTKAAQSLVMGEGSQRFDHVDIVSPSGEKLTVCFDITNFFGKF
jgi:hypothetical protein